MSAKTDIDYLRDMLEYAEKASSLVTGRNESELDTDPMFRCALQYCILIVGEAASYISEPTRSQLPCVPWREIVGMRNWLVHGYAGISARIVWGTATGNIPSLIEQILAFLTPEQT